MGSQFKYTIKDKCATLEENITPIPTIVLHHVVCFSLDPNVKTDKGNAAKPPVNNTKWAFVSRLQQIAKNNDRMAWTAVERLSGTRKQLKANMQYDKKSLGKRKLVVHY